jgi:hypothetical protein
MECEDIKSGKGLVRFREGLSDIHTFYTSKGLQIIFV